MTTKYNISAKFGQKEIISGDINSYFGHNTVNTEWTDNLIYRNSKICEVSTTFGDSQTKNNLLKSTEANFGSVLPTINEKIFADYFDKKSNFECQLMKKKDIVQGQKNDFFTNVLKLDNSNQDKENINKAIKDKFYELLKSDENLRKKLKINNNLSNLNIPGTTTTNINSNPVSNFNPKQPQQNPYIPYQNPNQMYQQQQGYYNNQQGGFNNYTYK
jgi:hypothetical protein